MGHPDGAHTHGSGGSGAAALDGIAQIIAALGLAVLAIDVVMWLLHILVIVAEGIGFAVLAAGGGFAWWKVRQLRARRQQPLVIVNQPAAAPVAAAPAPAELPRGGDIHLHIGSMAPADVAAIIREQRRAQLGAGAPRELPAGWQ